MATEQGRAAETLVQEAIERFPFVIIYRAGPEAVEIVRILHTS
jgi:hypothetical protein